MKSLKEQIEVMTHFMNGGEVECCDNNNWLIKDSNVFNWYDFDYRIKEEKKTVTIEKWLCKDLELNYYIVIQSDKIDEVLKYNSSESICKDKLIETYKVEL